MNTSEEQSFLSLFIDTPIYVIKNDNFDTPTPVEKLEEQTPPTIEQPELKFYGQNKYGVAIIVNYNNGDFLKSEEFNLLIKICEAVSLSLNEIAIINSNENKALEDLELNTLIGYSTLIHFGDIWEPTNIPSSKDLYQSLSIEGKTILLADDLAVLKNDVNAKRALWGALKVLFAKN
ncbi:MAG: hypothetical protein CMO01_06295 [Thalassobius sp.]|nr:hypothetical protein [Thalassovita sp.]|tara:strand:- start:2 stop:532 length:531 start_codon:yes stop_codon:yes gene_type:complete